MELKSLSIVFLLENFEIPFKLCHYKLIFSRDDSKNEKDAVLGLNVFAIKLESFSVGCYSESF